MQNAVMSVTLGDFGRLGTWSMNITAPTDDKV